MSVRGYHSSIGKIASIKIYAPEKELTSITLKTPIKNIVDSKFLYETELVNSVLHVPHEAVKQLLLVEDSIKFIKLKITVV